MEYARLQLNLPPIRASTLLARPSFSPRSVRTLWMTIKVKKKKVAFLGTQTAFYVTAWYVDNDFFGAKLILTNYFDGETKLDLFNEKHSNVIQKKKMMMMMNCFCGMVDQRKAFSLISSRDHCQRPSLPRISDKPRVGFEPVQNLSAGLVEWSCAVVITATGKLLVETSRKKLS